MEQTLKEIHNCLLDIMDVVDDICRENDIHYSLYAGSLLGAVRHKGYIPWDDDFDLVMTRDNYEKFIKVWDKTKPEGFFLQSKETEEFFTRSFIKIRKENTLFLQENEDPEKIHTGFFIDIFPIDLVPKNKLIFLKTFWDCARYQLYTREFIPPKGNWITKVIASFLLKKNDHYMRIRIRKRLLDSIKHNGVTYQSSWAIIETPWDLLHQYPSNMFDDYTNMSFENRKYMCVSNWREMLEIYFGNYMELPPESQRTWGHKPIYLDFDKSYIEFIKEHDSIE